MKKIISNTIIRVSKATIFIFVLLMYKLAEGLRSDILFAFILAMFLLELYKEAKAK